MMLRGIRGAITVDRCEREAVLSATEELLKAIVQANELQKEQIVSAIFTVTQDLQVAFPAEAARRLGWNQIPLIDALEIAVPGSLPHCVRVLLLAYTDKNLEEIRHIYLRNAEQLRRDLVES